MIVSQSIFVLIIYILGAVIAFKHLNSTYSIGFPNTRYAEPVLDTDSERQASFTFEDIGEDVRSNLASLGIVEPRDIQKAAWHAICDTNVANVLISAETGSGKTLAYTLPILHLLSTTERLVANPRVVMIYPNSLLVHQAHGVVSNILRGTGLRVEMIDDIETQEMPDIIMGTLPKLEKKLSIYNLNFKLDVFLNIAYLVLDEADQLVEQCNEKLLRQFLHRASHRVKTVLAAATVSTAGRLSTENTIRRLFEKINVVSTANVHAVPRHIEHESIYCKSYEDKITALHSALKQVQRQQRALIFCKSVESSIQLFTRLKKENPRMDLGLINRDVDVITQLKTLDPQTGNRYIVCTDAISRGIDIENISLVVQFDFPKNVLDYIHRAGRAARNMLNGRTVLLWEDGDREFCELLNKHMNDLPSLFSRKRGLRKKIKRGISIGTTTVP